MEILKYKLRLRRPPTSRPICYHSAQLSEGHAPIFSREVTVIDKLFRVNSLPIAAAGLALAGAPNVALADHCKGKHKTDPGCSSGGDGDITGVQLFGQDIVGNDGIAHESNLSPVVLPDGAGFTLHVRAAEVDLRKLDTHRPMKKSKRVEFVGTFTLGDMIYTPDP